MTKLDFTKRFFDELQEKVDGIELSDLTELAIHTMYNGEEVKHFLGNAYAQYIQAPDEIEEILKAYIAGSLSSYQPSMALSADRIVPIVKDICFVKSLMNLHEAGVSNHVFEQYNEELFVFYAQDKEHSISYLLQDDVSSNDINIDELYNASINNLLDILPDIECHGGDGYYMLTAGGDYESSLILMNGIWRQELSK